MRVVLAALLLALPLLAGCAENEPPEEILDDPATDPATDDVVVVAVVDSGFNPYHHDFLAEYMPQALNDDPDDDLPLDRDPSTWVPGYPAPDEFASYDALKLSLTTDPQTETNGLHDQDGAEWSKVKQTSLESVNMVWIPGTKVIGAVTFGGGDGYASGSHGVGTSSVSVGNFHGTCPHCLLVFVDGLGEEANRWVEQQDWIDLQTNSWGFSSTLVLRDRVYAGSDVDSQRDAVDRGQSIFFSSGNGIEGGFVATNPTLFSSQEGPDWITTVGAVLPDGTSTGSGKPADVAAPGSGYESAYGSSTTNGTGLFGGTSNATPVTAGIYGEALYQLRRHLVGPSRIQEGGVIAKGTNPGCGVADVAAIAMPSQADAASASMVFDMCALADGNLTVHELREALFRSATYTPEGWDVGGATGPIPATDNQAELTFLAEGHGTFWGRMKGNDNYVAELDRVVGFAKGEWFEDQDSDQLQWFVADSVCRQGGWGAWDNGYAGTFAVEVAPDWPVRNWMASVCPEFLAAAVMAERMLPSPNDLPL